MRGLRDVVLLVAQWLFVAVVDAPGNLFSLLFIGYLKFGNISPERLNIFIQLISGRGGFNHLNDSANGDKDAPASNGPRPDVRHHTIH